MELRRATAADTDAILTFWKTSRAEVSATDTPEHVHRVIEHPGARFVVAVEDGQIVGSVIGAFDGWRGNIYRLVVHPDYRRRGIARSLVREVERVFAEWGVTRVAALVARDRDLAKKFWAAVGYVPDRRMRRQVKSIESTK
jgi:ribosomal protein S18 acetylase RimI-like enzyme